MSEHLLNGVFSIAAAIVGLAVLAILVSRNANTSGVLGAAGTAFSGALSAAEAPVTGNSFMASNAFNFGGY